MKLPEIRYNPNIRPLAKEDTSLPLKAAQNEINLSKARLGAELDVASKDYQANIALSNARLAADQDFIHSQASIATEVKNLKTQNKANQNIMVANIVSSLAQTALQQGAKWQAAREEANVATGITTYGTKVRAIAAELDQPTIDLNKYSDVDFSSIPKNMIYEGTDAVTGQPVRSAPHHVAAPLIYVAREAAIRESVGSDIGSVYSKAQLDNGIAHTKGAVDAGMVKNAYDYERKFLSGQYDQALNTAIQQGDLHTSLGIIDSAEARGVWTVDYAADKRGSIKGDIKFSALMRQADQASTMDELKLVREAAYELPKSEQISIRSVVAGREHQLEREFEKQQTINERISLARNAETAVDVAIGAGGMGNFEAGRAALVKWAEQNDPEHLQDYTQAWRVRFNQAKSAENYQINRITDQAYEDISKNPNAPIPAAVTGKDYETLVKLKEMGLAGTARTTDMRTWSELHDKMVSDPAGFKKMQIGQYMSKLDEQDYKMFKNAQAKIGSDSWEPTSTESASAQFDNFARQAFGRGFKDNDNAAALQHGYINAVDQFEQSKGGKSTTAERQAILTDLFKAKVPTFNKSIMGGIRKTSSTVVKSDMAPYIPAISTILKQSGVPVTAANIAAEYNARLQAGRLEELEP